VNRERAVSAGRVQIIMASRSILNHYSKPLVFS
jgi:hypothetical protein